MLQPPVTPQKGRDHQAQGRPGGEPHTEDRLDSPATGMEGLGPHGAPGSTHEGRVVRGDQQAFSREEFPETATIHLAERSTKEGFQKQEPLDKPVVLGHGRPPQSPRLPRASSESPPYLAQSQGHPHCPNHGP